MIRKVRKLNRSSRAQLRGSAARAMFWHLGTPNFGDDINPDLFEALSGQRIRLCRDRQRAHFLGMGSILGKATPQSVVLGSGLLEPVQTAPAPGRVVALRGALSARALGLEGTVPLGDPLVLVDRLMRPEGGEDVGLIPHVRSLPALRRNLPPGLRLIDVSRPPWQVLRDIGRCRVVLSQSLHGLIAADAFSIPSLWLAPSEQMQGGRFKFDDYFSTLDATRTAYPITAALLRDPPLAEASVGRYTGHKAELQAHLSAALTEGAAA
ncbi:polysaccharide pyruvyl transferase family protein [Oceanicola sp. S124]|uniref:polysaccharide pyruvyl transferase family protein n=1 Tax=Oceanicola sp. S124 TaxID=1042378 RepID=UPI0002557E48|nr:polysaccharide pyruvyl transferase family protein [Oceanicola sp. S124]